MLKTVSIVIVNFLLVATIVINVLIMHSESINLSSHVRNQLLYWLVDWFSTF